MARTNALREVVSFEVRRTLTKKRFWLATMLVPGLLVFIFAISIASGSSSDAAAQAQSSSHFDFEYVDGSHLIDHELARAAGGTVAASVTDGIANVKAGKVTALFVFPADPSTQAIETYGANDGIFGNSKYGAAATNLLQASAAKQVGSSQLNAIIRGAVATHTTTYEDGRVAGGIESVVAPMLYVIVLYFVVILMGNQMLNATVEEKENRVSEMILTTIRAKALLVGKVISLFIIGFVQMVAFATPVAVAYAFFRDKVNIPDVDLTALQFETGPMVIGALLLAGSFSLFTATLVAVGAAMPTAKDAGPFFAGILITLFLPIYIVSLIVTSPEVPIVQVFTLFPYTAPVTSLVRNALGSLPLWMAIVDIVVLFGLAAIVLQAAVGVFKYGSIEYAKKVSLKEVFARRGKR